MSVIFLSRIVLTVGGKLAVLIFFSYVESPSYRDLTVWVASHGAQLWQDCCDWNGGSNVRSDGECCNWSKIIKQ